MMGAALKATSFFYVASGRAECYNISNENKEL